MNIRRVIFLVIALTILCFSISVFADVGNTFSSEGSGFGGGSYSSSGSHSGEMDIAWIVYMFLSLPFPLNIIFLAIVIVAVLYFANQRKGTSTNSNLSRNTPPPVIKEFNQNEIKANDPDFSKYEFIAFVRDVFIKVQEAWEARKWELVRPFESNELFETHKDQLREYINTERFPHLDNQEIRDVIVTKYEVDGKFEYLTVYLKASLIDYVTDNAGKIVSGSNTAIRAREYKLIFKRVKGIQTKELKNSTTNCPNCGAPTEVTSSGKCSYCDSVITTGEYGWVMDGYSAWNPDYR